MRHFLDPIRSVLFNILFYSWTLAYASLIVLPAGLVFGQTWARRGVFGYCVVARQLARWVMGIRVDIRGADRLPKEGGLILAAAHQSNFDPILTYLMRPDLTALAKKELFAVPVIGAILKIMGIIRIDRAKGTAHEGMAEVGRRVREEGLLLLVYPQATRIRPGTRKTLKSGAYHLAQDTGLPVYTVATTSGLFWSRGFFHRSGTLIVEVVRRLPDGLGKGAFMQAVDADIVLRSERLALESGVANRLAEPGRSEMLQLTSD